RLGLAGGPREIPGVGEDVPGDDHVDCLGERLGAERRLDRLAGESRVSERLADARLHGFPGTDRIVLDGRYGRELDPFGAEERRDPLGEVTDDVSGRPALAG